MVTWVSPDVIAFKLSVYFPVQQGFLFPLLAFSSVVASLFGSKPYVKGLHQVGITRCFSTKKGGGKSSSSIGRSLKLAVRKPLLSSLAELISVVELSVK